MRVKCEYSLDQCNNFSHCIIASRMLVSWSLIEARITVTKLTVSSLSWKSKNWFLKIIALDCGCTLKWDIAQAFNDRTPEFFSSCYDQELLPEFCEMLTNIMLRRRKKKENVCLNVVRHWRLWLRWMKEIRDKHVSMSYDADNVCDERIKESLDIAMNPQGIDIKI